jgi:hypothetical protein
MTEVNPAGNTPGSVPHHVPAASQDAWQYYLRCLDEARARLLSSVWASGPTERAQAQYCIQMLAAFGFNIYCAPRQAYPNFYLQTIFLPFEYGFGLPCPDFHYRWTFLDGARDYRIHGKLGRSRWIEFQAQRGFWGDENQSRLGNWDFDDFEVGADGSFEIIASSRKQGDNWIELDPACRNITLMARDALYDWDTDVPMDVHVEHLGPAPAGPLAHTEDDMNRRLRAAGRLVKFSVDFFQDLSASIVRAAGGHNRFMMQPMQSTSNVGGNPRAGYMQMMYDIPDGEALVVEVDVPDARYWSLHVGDPWWQTTDYAHHHSSLNGHQARIDADGRVRIVMSRQDPGVPNWIDTVDNTTGIALWRWYLADSHPMPVVRQMAVDRVRSCLPAETPQVSVEQRRAVVAARGAAVLRRFHL